MANDVGGRQHGLDRPGRVVQRHVEDFLLLGGLGISDLHLEHEAIDLGLGQRIRPLLLDRVLRGHDQEEPFERIRAVADGDLPLLHGFQQGRLHFRRGAVDFVGKDEVGEDRPLAGAEGRFAGHVDHRAQQIGGQQIGRKLDAAKVGRQRLGQRLDGRRLGQARHALQEDVPVGQQPDQQAGDHLLLADDGLAQLGLQTMNRFGLLRNAILDLVDVDLHYYLSKYPAFSTLSNVSVPGGFLL